MRMKLISVAIGALVSASAFAQSNVTVYGILDIGLFSIDDDAGNGMTMPAMVSPPSSRAAGARRFWGSRVVKILVMV